MSAEACSFDENGVTAHASPGLHLVLESEVTLFLYAHHWLRADPLEDVVAASQTRGLGASTLSLPPCPLSLSVREEMHRSTACSASYPRLHCHMPGHGRLPSESYF